MSTANAYAGEAELVINGCPCRLKLTLGALVALESHLAEDSLMALVQRFETARFSASDVLALLAAGLAGAGHDMTRQDLARADIAGGPVAAAQVAAELLARSFALPGAP